MSTPYLRVAATSSLLLLACACSTKVQGSPSVAPPSTPDGKPASALVPCEVLNKVMGPLGYAAGAPDIADKKNSCGTQNATDTIGVHIQADRAYDAGPSQGQVTKGHVGSRKLLQEREPIGAKGDCSIILEVHPESRVSVIVTRLDRNTDEACKTAQDLASKLDETLPP